MACDRSASVLHAYVDDELDAAGSAEFERHLERCPECAETLPGLRALRSLCADQKLYHRAPESLRKRVLGEMGPVRDSAMPGGSAWRWLAVAAVILLLAAIGWQAVSSRHGTDGSSLLAAEVIDAHLRSLQPGHLTDVLSSDQHTVKPWFDGRVDFAPPVRDFSQQGFLLQGGRLDAIHGRTVAALVYGRRKHLISVFVWPADNDQGPGRSGSQQGYQWSEWRNEGMEFWAVSDTSLSDLEELQRLFSK
jgi:anti-sigma factor RsiW